MASFTAGFVATAGTNLTAYTAPDGTTFTLAQGTSLVIDPSGQLCNATTSSDYVYASFAPGSADEEVIAVMVVANAGKTGCGPCVRLSTDGQNMYHVAYYGGQFQFQKRVAGTYTQLGSPFTAGVGTYTIRLRALGTALTVDIDSGSGYVNRFSVTDSGVTAAGKIGVGSVFADANPGTGNIYITSLTGSDYTPVPTISVQPADQTVNAAGTATFAVTASSLVGSPTYQWQDDSGGSFANIGGATSASLNVSSVTYAMQGRRYQCVVSNANGSVTSTIAVLRVAYNLSGTGPRAYPLLGGGPFGSGDFAMLDLAPFTATGNTVQPGAGAVVFTGLAPAAAVTNNRTAQPGVGAIVFSGLAPFALRGTITALPVGSVSITGLQPTVFVERYAQPGAGAIVFTGLAPATLVSDQRTALPGAGSIVFTGQQPVAVTGDNRTALPGAGAIVFAGQQPTAAATDNRTALPGAGAIVFTGQQPAAITGDNRTAQPGAGALTYNGQQPTTVATDNRTTQPDAGALTYSGQAPTALRATITALPAGSISITGLQPTAFAERYVQPGAGAVVISGLQPSAAVSDQRTALPDAGAVVISGQQPTAATSDNRTAQPGVGALTYTGQQPAAIAGGSVVAQPASGAVAITGQQPTALAADNRTALPGAGTEVYTGRQPAVTVSDERTALPGAGVVAITGRAPTALRTDNQVAQPDAGTVAFTGLQPSLAGAVTALPDVGSVVFEGLAPTVLNTSPQEDDLLSAKFQGRRKNVPFKPLKTEPVPVFVPNVIDPPPVPPAARGRGIDLGLLRGEPPEEPEEAPAAAAAPAPKPKPKPKPTAAPAAVQPPPVSPTTVSPAAPALPRVSEVALLEVVRELVDGREAALRDELALLRATITDMQAREAKRAQQERNQRRAAEIAAKLLAD